MPIRGGVWGGYIGRTAYPPPHKVKKIYQRKSIRKVISQCVSVLIQIPTPLSNGVCPSAFVEINDWIRLGILRNGILFMIINVIQ